MHKRFSSQLMTIRFLVFVGISGFVSACSNINNSGINIDDRASATFTVMAFNIRHGCGREDWGNTSGAFFKGCEKKYDEIIAAIHSADPDVVGLQEVNDGQAELIANALNMNYVYKSHNAVGYGSWWGNAVLSKFRIVDSDLIELGAFNGRSRSMLTATADVQGQTLLFASIHTDHRLSDNRSVKKILEYTKSAGMPVILIGDFNMEPDSAGIAFLLKGTGFSDSAGEPATKNLGTWGSPSGRRIDYIFTQPEYIRISDVGLVDSKYHSASDHLAYYATVSVRRIIAN